ncbi:gamma-glutamylcyclotransferase [Fulvimarina sp. 2208YS6-2-32]|uniref:Gamma-glutamylcyclotransferase n=1 Tax=Fulvimarina uroteuthidis TaxID=3098149 RepID=A0ABU5I3A9_9HYPH|nr:gamma-glutamylcyclotransferase [Fulvimarina sp. 2208YS6-2-32]MDY8109617.1 gamma-glutamylcyclotransferase [Fulvimarina sp. 2208YS6-2-32]
MTEYIAFYGSLMERAKDPSAPSRAGLSKFVEPCRLEGVLRDHGHYPGYFPADGSIEPHAVTPPIVEAELHEIVAPHALLIFDRWEEYDPDDEANSLYLRRKVRLLEPDIEAWIYMSLISDEDPVVPNGDWAAYRSETPKV